jgi:hypothetical protein
MGTGPRGERPDPAEKLRETKEPPLCRTEAPNMKKIE